MSVALAVRVASAAPRRDARTARTGYGAPVTFSIVARDGDAWGVAVASKFLAAGAVVPAARAGVGAIASQAFLNLAWLSEGLDQLSKGRTAQQVLDALVAADDGRDERQGGIVDAAGRSATYTGSGCIPWAGGVAGQEYACQGNCLTGPDVVDGMAATFSAASGTLARRLLAALTAGDAAGGDKRGRQSAGLLVVTPGGGYGGGSDVLVDLRADDSPAPVVELARLLDLHELYFGEPEDLQPLTGSLADEVSDALATLGYGGDGPLDERLFAWLGWANYEERHVGGSIDGVVLGKLREAAALGYTP